MRIPGNKLADAVASAARQVSRGTQKAADTLAKSGELEAAGTAVKDFFQGAVEKGKPMVASSEAWGSTIGVDDGKHPRSFGYGKHGNTLAESTELWKSETTEERRNWFGTNETVATTTREHGLHARAFGDHDGRTVSAKLGAELEAGAKELDQRAGTTTETFVGVRGRAYAEGGLLGQTVGAEAFAGADRFQQHGEEKGGENWAVSREQGWVGARGVGKVHTGPTFSAIARGEIGAGYRFSFDQHQQVAGPLGIVNRAAMDFFAGALVQESASVGPTGAGVTLEAFAGAKMGLEESASLAYEGSEVLGLKMRGEGWVGVGAKADARVGLDLEKRSIDARMSVGAAVGAGGSVDLGVTVAGDQLLSKTVDGKDGESAGGEKGKTLAELPSLPRFIKG